MWQTLTHPVLAAPVGARPFLLSGFGAASITPFINVDVTGCQLDIQIGEVAVIKGLYFAYDTTVIPSANIYWSLNKDGVQVGPGYGAIYTRSVGFFTANGILWWPVDLRITGPALVSMTATDTASVGTTRTIAGMIQGWTYPASYDAPVNAAPG